MSRRCSDGSRAWLETLAFALALTLTGCATPGGEVTAPVAPREVAAEVAPEPADDAGRARPGRAPQIEVTAGTFTLVESASIGADARADYREAQAHLAREDYARGIELLRRVTEVAPDVTAPFIDLGIAYRASGDYEAAVASFADALVLVPEHPVAHNELGIAQRRLGRFADARRSYERALEVQPAFHYARRNLGVLCDLYLSDPACALEHYEIYRQAVPDDREVEMWVGDIRHRLAADR